MWYQVIAGQADFMNKTKLTSFPTRALRVVAPVLCAVFLPAVLRGVCFAIDPNAGTSAATFLKLGAGSPRAQALGRAYVAIAEGPEALVWNPAGIAASQTKEVHFSYLSWLQDYSGQYMGYVHPMGRTVIGANMAYFSMSGFDVRDEAGIPQQGETVRSQSGFGTLSIARSFFLENLYLGASVKSVLEDNDGTRYSNTVFDLGAVVKLGRKISLGWSMMNLSGNKQDIVQVQRLGAAFHLNSIFTLSVENEMPSDNRSRVGVGAEFTIPEQILQVGRLSFRAGYFSADNYGQSFDGFLRRFNLDRTSGISFGFGLYTSEVFGYGMGIDYALVPYGALGKSNQIAVRFQF